MLRKDKCNKKNGKIFRGTLVVVGIKIACFASWSTITRIELQLEEVERVSMKSIKIEFQGQSGIESCLRRPYGLCLCGLACIQVVHDFQ